MSALIPTAPPWAHVVADLIRKMTVSNVRCDGPLFHLMPYCLHEMDDRPKRCIVNRRYKPIGQRTPDYASYKSATGQHISLAEFKALLCAGVVDERGYLHDDSTSPRKAGGELAAYREKLRTMVAPYVAP